LKRWLRRFRKHEKYILLQHDIRPHATMEAI
jgi:hypothetical protein